MLSSDTPEGIAKSLGLGTIGFSQAYAHFRPDLLIVLGDRFEMYAAALAALPFKIPVVHIHGGEITLGAIDDALRHSITKLSHIHFVATKEYARRIAQLGEEPWRIKVTAAPSLDNLLLVKLLNIDELESQYDLSLDSPPLIVTFHPVTLEYERTEWQMGELLAALDDFEMPIVFTLPNAETGGRIISHMIDNFIQTHASAQMVFNLGIQGYFSMMSAASAMVGNSSSGIVEATSFEPPVVNIGNRQGGRVKGANVIDVDYERTNILEGLRKALDPQFRLKLRGIKNPYGSGRASEKIIDALKHIRLDDKPLIKRFYDLGG